MCFSHTLTADREGEYMPQNKDLPQRIRYEYALDTHANLHLAHGVWGGVNPQGEIELNFYTESDKMPSFSECLIHPRHGIEQEITPTDENVRTIVRHVHSRVVLNYYAARAMLEWLEDRLETLETEEGLPPLLMDNDTGVAQ